MNSLAQNLQLEELQEHQYNGITLQSHPQWCRTEDLPQLPCQTLVDASLLAILEVTGPDAHSWLQGQLSQDLKTVDSTTPVLCANATSKGKINALLEVHRLEDGYALLHWKADSENLLQQLDMYCITEDVCMQYTKHPPLLLALGAETAALFTEGWPSNWIQPHSRLILDHHHCPDLSDTHCHVLHPLELEALRIACHFPQSGVDYANQKELVPELGRKGWIDYQKGCFLGQEVFARIKTYGRTNKVLARLRIQSENPDSLRHQPISVEGKSRGTVRSVAPLKGECLAMGYVPTAKTAVGTTIEVAGFQGFIEALEE